jgi:ArsR family transcriptional regulator
MVNSRTAQMIPLLRALADPTRLRLINLIGDQEVCVCFFVEVLGLSQPKISRHLAYLRRVGIVHARREGKWMHYKILKPKDTRVARVLREVREALAADEDMSRERQRLVKVGCATELRFSYAGHRGRQQRN